MENFTKIPMLYFDFKSSNSQPNFSDSFQNRIKLFYKQNPELYLNEIKEFEILRLNATRFSHDVNGISLLKKYYIQLLIASNKFKYSKGQCDIKFTWVDIFTKQNVNGDIQLELDSILYNIGALHSKLGATCKRNSSENMKIACTHFQSAAWVFKKLKENSYFLSKDLSKNIMSFNHLTMLAQAQECVLEKSILDNKQPKIIAKVCSEIIKFYDNLIAILLQSESLNKDCLIELVGHKIYKDWKRFIEFKIVYYSAVCDYFMGNCLDLKIGERIAWYLSAKENLKESIKLFKLTDQNLIDLTKYLSESIELELEKSKKDNDFIYYESILNSDQLTAVKGVCLVKETGFNISDPELSGKDIFGRLISIEAFKTVSLYSESRDEMWRNVKTKLEKKNDELVKFLSVINLDKQSVRKRKFYVPEKLVSICASLSLNPNLLEEVKDKLIRLEDMYNDIDIKFKNLEKMINQEKENEKNNLTKNKKFNYSQIFKQCLDDFEKHYKIHQSSKNSNQVLKNIIDKNEKDIELLINCSVQDLEELFTASADDLPIDKNNLNELERLFDKVDEMQKQRDNLVNQLQESILKDDILRKVIVNSNQEMNEIFEKELKKFDVYINYLELNIKAQENIINAITRANADYVDTRKAFIKIEELREEKIESLFQAYENFQNVIINLDKGIEFYNQLTDILKKIDKEVKIQIKSNENTKKLDLEETYKILNQENNFKKLPLTPDSNQPKLKNFLNYMNSSKINSPINPSVQTINTINPDAWKSYGTYLTYNIPNTYSIPNNNQNFNSIYTNTPSTNTNTLNVSTLYNKNDSNQISNQGYNYNYWNYNNNNLNYSSNLSTIINPNQMYNQYSNQSVQETSQNIPNINVNSNLPCNYSYNQQALSNNYVQSLPSLIQHNNYFPVQEINNSMQQLNISNSIDYLNSNNSSNQSKNLNNILDSSNDLSIVTQPILTPISVTTSSKISIEENNKQSLV